MDTSKEYIKMCEEAKEIQKRKDVTRDGDYFATDDEYYEPGFFNCHDEFECYCKTALAEGEGAPKRMTWLPRQDQLQEMLLADPDNRFDTTVCYITLTYNFARFCGIDDEDAEGMSNVDLRKESLEVLWLAFVMAEMYSKEWNGKKWVKSKDIDMGRRAVDAAWNKIFEAN